MFFVEVKKLNRIQIILYRLSNSRRLISPIVVLLSLYCFCLPSYARKNPEEAKAVQIFNYLTGNNEITTGTGVFICPDILVTAFHVVDEFLGSVKDRLIFLDPYTNDKIPITTIVGLSEKYDLAALKAEGYQPNNCYPISSLSEIDVNHSNPVIFYGFNNEDYNLVGIPGRITEEVFYRDDSFQLIRTQSYNRDLSLMSGAPVFSESNKLMGVVIRSFAMDVLFVSNSRLRNFLSQSEMLCASHQCVNEEQGQLLLQAEAGNGIAQDQMGFREYKLGNYKEAVDWYKKAALQGGVPGAYYSVGFMYRRGYGVPRDGEQALFWFTEASSRGIPLADYMMGLIYFNGRIVKRDFKKAIRRFDRAARAGYPQAEYAIGVMLEEVHGVLKNTAAAKGWYQRSARQGYPPAIKKLAELN